MKLSTIRVDEELATKGIDAPFGEPENGKQATIKVAFAGNQNFRNKLARLTRNASQQIPGRDLPPETFMKLNREALIGTVFLGWENFEEDDGTTIDAYDSKGNLIEDTARRLLSETVIHDFVFAQANRLESFQKGKADAATAAIKSGPALAPEASG